MRPKGKPMPKLPTWILRALLLIASSLIWLTPMTAFAKDSKSLSACKTALATANDVATEALDNADAAAKLTKDAQAREEDAKKQRDTNAGLARDNGTERDNLAGEIFGMKKEATRFRVEFAGLQLRHQDLELRHGREWSPYTWMGIGAGGTIAAWLTWNFVVAPRLFAN